MKAPPPRVRYSGLALAAQLARAGRPGFSESACSNPCPCVRVLGSLVRHKSCTHLRPIKFPERCRRSIPAVPVSCHAALESSMARPMETRMYDRLSNFRSKMSGQERGWGYRDADEHRGVGARKRSGKFIRPVSIIRSERSERKFVGAGVSVRITAGLANSRRMKLRERKAQVSAKKSDRHY